HAITQCGRAVRGLVPESGFSRLWQRILLHTVDRTSGQWHNRSRYCYIEKRARQFVLRSSPAAVMLHKSAVMLHKSRTKIPLDKSVTLLPERIAKKLLALEQTAQ